MRGEGISGSARERDARDAAFGVPPRCDGGSRLARHWAVALLAGLTIIGCSEARAQQGPFLYVPNSGGANQITVIDSQTNAILQSFATTDPGTIAGPPAQPAPPAVAATPARPHSP